MRSIFPLSAVLALTACATFPAAAPIRSDGRARLDQATRVGALVVTPRAIVEDSRCPINARCVWAGRAIVRADVAGSGWHEARDLTLGERITIHGFPLGLVSIDPGRTAGQQSTLAQGPLFGFEGGV
jgi:hypothetical protein